MTDSLDSKSRSPAPSDDAVENVARLLADQFAEIVTVPWNETDARTQEDIRGIARMILQLRGRSPAEVPPAETLELRNVVLGGFNEHGDYNGDPKYILELCAAVWRSAQQ